jgi:Tfp pilus assembly protein PilF
MSLINQMLKDLEARRGTSGFEGVGIIAADASESSQAQNSHHRRLLLTVTAAMGGVILLLAGIIGYLLWSGVAPGSAGDGEILPSAVTGVKAIPPPSAQPAPEPPPVVTAPPRVVVPPSPPPSPPPVALSPAAPLPADPIAPSPPVVAPPLADNSPGGVVVAPAIMTTPTPALEGVIAAAPLRVEPALSPGSDRLARFVMRGSNIDRNSRIEVAWDGRRKILDPQRVVWINHEAIAFEIVTGTTPRLWLARIHHADEASPWVEFQIASVETGSLSRRHEPVATPVPPPSPAAEATTVAEGDFNLTSRLTPEELRAHQLHQQGVTALQQGNQRRARDFWQAALKEFPRHLASREALASLLIATGQPLEAEALLGEGVELHPEHGRFVAAYARLIAERGDTAAAILRLEALLARQPNAGSEAVALLAALYQQAGNHSDAVTRYRQVISADPQQANSWVALSISLEALGERADAVVALREAARIGNMLPEVERYVEQRLQQLNRR